MQFEILKAFDHSFDGTTSERYSEGETREVADANVQGLASEDYIGDVVFDFEPFVAVETKPVIVEEPEVVEEPDVVETPDVLEEVVETPETPEKSPPPKNKKKNR